MEGQQRTRHGCEDQREPRVNCMTIWRPWWNTGAPRRHAGALTWPPPPA